MFRIYFKGAKGEEHCRTTGPVEKEELEQLKQKYRTLLNEGAQLTRYTVSKYPELPEINILHGTFEKRDLYKLKQMLCVETIDEIIDVLLKIKHTNTDRDICEEMVFPAYSTINKQFTCL